MTADQLRTFALTLPYAVETMQWGDNLLLWVGAKVIGGRMFALINLETGRHGVVSFPAGAERFGELVEREDLIPAPYMARNFWVAAQTWNALSDSEWRDQIRASHALTLAKLPPRTRKMLDLPARERNKIVAERTASLKLKPK